ncbi:hypothetical protein [Brachybacterium alimentarium]|uniref:hypothetical protein n=1 Tax=Brachybacterium alimentarium TaxID=47845 RepID=UPI003FD3DF42
MQKLIDEAQELSNEELFKKAIEESDGKTMYGIGNSSRGSTAATAFIETLQEIDSSYRGTVEWSQPKNNSIFTTLNADMDSRSHTYSMTLIQDGNQIQSKMIDTGNLLNFIPKEWKDAEGVDVAENGTPLALQTISKVFMVNNLGNKEYTNVWQFVADGEKPLFMDVNSEPVGKNFLYMLTQGTYADQVKAAFDALDASEQAQFTPTVEAMQEEAASLGLEAENAVYALAWIRRWVAQYNKQTDDGPISQELVSQSAEGETGLLVYSKLRSIEESSQSSVNNVTIAAYQDGYVGFGGYAYKHYLMIPKTSPLPWTGMAFNAFMATTTEGFDAWGKDIGGWSANPQINQDHSDDGGDEFPGLNDRGYDWWLADDGGALVLEDPEYSAQVSADLGDWIDANVGVPES